MPAPAPKAATRINETVKPPDDLKAALSILSKDEWVHLQAFCDTGINDNPSTEAMMRVKLALKDGDELKQDFKEAVTLYNQLKGYCTTFRDDIKPNTMKLANDIVQYNRTAQVIYKHIIAMLEAYDRTGKASPDGWKKLLDELGKMNPPAEVLKIQTDLVKYIKRLADEATERSKTAQDLKLKLGDFKNNLAASKSAFDLRNSNFAQKLLELAPLLTSLQADFEALQAELKVLRKKEQDEIIVLSTAPAYLVIPGLGILIMSGVLIGVGIDLALLRENLNAKQATFREKQANLTRQQMFYANFGTATKMVSQTSKDIDTILPLVEKLDKAWSALASDLQDLKKNLESANLEALNKDWGLATIDLEVAQNTWASLSEQADQYRRFGDAKRVDNMNDLTKAVKAA